MFDYDKFDLQYIVYALKQRDRMVLMKYPNERFKVYIVGGAALMIYGQVSKITNDIDVISISDKKIENIMLAEPINDRVRSSLDSFSTEAETRAQLVDIEGGTLSVDYYMYSLEDIVASKLYAGRRKDLIDLKNTYIKEIIDYDLLDIIVYEEMKMDALNERRWQELVDYYEMYKEGTLWDDL